MEIYVGINDVIRNFSSNFELIYNEHLKPQDNTDVVTTELEYELAKETFIHKNRFADLSHTQINSDPILEKDIIYQEKPPLEDELIETGLPTYLNIKSENDELLLTHRYLFSSEEEYFYYMFSQFAFELFAKPQLTYKEAIINLNEFIFLEKNKNNITIFSQEIHNARPSTLHFLAREKFVGPNIVFFESLAGFWDKVDIAITTSPYILGTAPKGKVAIKINTPYNQKYPSDLSFPSFKEFLTHYKEKQK